MKIFFGNRKQKIVIAMLLSTLASLIAGDAISSKTGACDFSCKKKEALLGDGETAYQLGNGFLYSDREKMKHWYRVSAENGNIKGQYNYAHFLVVDSQNADDCFRAIFWFSKAAARGHKASVDAHEVLLKATRSGDEFLKGCAQRYD